jgi:quercetin dioxygenase-like cupin family protein
MKKITVDDVDPAPSPASIKRRLTGPLGANEVALTYYELEEGESSAFGYHAHELQEEIFYVCRGTLTLRTDSTSLTASAGEAVRIPPGQLQQASNEQKNRVVMLAVGAPQESGSLRLIRCCQTCNEETPQEIIDAEPGQVRETVCAECGETTGRFTT